MQRSTIMKLSLFAVLIMLVVPVAGAQTPTTSSSGSAPTLITDICNGTTTNNGIIAAAPVIGTGTQGVASVVELTSIIMLCVIMATAGLFMLSKAVALPGLGNIVKVELTEMFGTALIIGIFFGGFFATAYAAWGSTSSLPTTGPGATLHFTGPGRAIFVGDCEMLSAGSLGMVLPLISSGTVNYILNIITSVSFKVTPGGFGFSVAPLSGMSLIASTLDQLEGIVSGFVIVIFAVVFMLGFIYSLFPIFLYLGIILRALPWTRAAGGIFIAMFIGFYIVFPLMLFATIHGFSTIAYQNTVTYLNSSSVQSLTSFTTATNSTTVTNVGNLAAISSGYSSLSGFFGYAGNIMGSLGGFSNNYGVINGFIYEFLGPAIVIMVEIAFSFIIALDFADVLADVLGAPSLSTESLLSKVI